MRQLQLFTFLFILIFNDVKMSPFRCDELSANLYTKNENKNRNRKDLLTNTFEYKNPKNGRRGVACLLTTGNGLEKESLIYIEEEIKPEFHIQALGRAYPHPNKKHLSTGNLIILSTATKNDRKSESNTNNIFSFKLSSNQKTGLSTFTLKSEDPETKDLVFLWKPREFVYNWTMRVDIPKYCGTGLETFYMKDPIRKENPDRNGIICKFTDLSTDTESTLSNYNSDKNRGDKKVVNLFGIGWRKSGSASGAPRKFINFITLRPEGDNFFNIFKGSVFEFAFPDSLDLPATDRDRKFFKNPLFITAVRSLKTKNYRIFGQIQEEWHHQALMKNSNAYSPSSCPTGESDSFPLLPLKFKKDFSDELTDLRGFEIFSKSKNYPIEFYKRKMRTKKQQQQQQQFNNIKFSADNDRDEIEHISDTSERAPDDIQPSSPSTTKLRNFSISEFLRQNNGASADSDVKIRSLPPISISSSMEVTNNLASNKETQTMSANQNNLNKDIVIPSTPIQNRVSLLGNGSGDSSINNSISTNTTTEMNRSPSPDSKRYEIVTPSIPITQMSTNRNVNQYSGIPGFVSSFFSTNSNEGSTDSIVMPFRLSNTTEIINGYNPETAFQPVSKNTIIPSVPINPVQRYPDPNPNNYPQIPTMENPFLSSMQFGNPQSQTQPYFNPFQFGQMQYPFRFAPQQYQLPPPFSPFNSYLPNQPVGSGLGSVTVTTTITASTSLTPLMATATSTAYVTVTQTPSLTVPTSLSLDGFYI